MLYHIAKKIFMQNMTYSFFLFWGEICNCLDGFCEVHPIYGEQ